MSSAPNRTPSYRLHKPSGLAVVTIDGRDVYLGSHGTDASRAEYERVVGEWLASSKRPDVGHGFTVSELLAAYLKHATAYYVKNGAPTKEISAIKTAMRPLRRMYGHTPACLFGPRALKVVREEFIRAGHCRSGINKSVDRIKRIFRWGVSEEHIPASVYQALASVPGLRKGRSAAPESPKVRPVADEHVNALKPFLTETLWAMVDLTRATAMRPGEVCIIRGVDLDTSGAIWEYRPHTYKTEHHEGSERVIPLGPRAQAIIKPFLKTDLEAYLFTPEESERARSQTRRNARVTPRYPSHFRPVRERRLAERHDSHAFAVAIRRACDRVFRRRRLLAPEKREELKAWRRAHRWAPNRLRHAAATRIRKELGLEAAQVVLGHTHADVTQVYAERNLELAREIARKIG